MEVLRASRVSGGIQRLLPLWLPAVVSACGGSSDPPAADLGYEREVLEDGRVEVRYGSLAGTPVELSPDLTLGVVDGDPNLTFGAVKGVEAASDGTIYVLDSQASEIRAFDRDGRFLRTLTRKGEGPGEIGEANGMILKGDSLLWVQNHSSWQMLALDLDGDELARVPKPVRSYGWIWGGTVDDRGRIWKEEWHSDEEPVFPPPEGLQESAVRRFLIHFDLASEERDSVFVGESTARTFIAALGDRGWAHYPVPFDPEARHVVDPTSGIWASDPSGYSVARLDEAGDTTLLLTVDLAAQPVTQADRAEFMDRVLEGGPGRVRAAEEVSP